MSDAPGPSPAPAKESRWEDLIDAFISPVELFRRRTDGKFGHGLLALIILLVVVFFATRSAIQPIMDAEFQRQMANRPNLTPEQLEAGRRIAGTFAPVFVVVGIPITIFVLAAVVWLVARIVGGAARLNYAQAATITTFAYFPKVLDYISGGVQALLMDESKLNSRFSVSLGAARFFNPDSSSHALVALLGRLDLFTLWITVLIAVGIKQMARTTTGQAVAAGALVWLIGALPTLYQALRAG